MSRSEKESTIREFLDSVFHYRFSDIEEEVKNSLDTPVEVGTLYEVFESMTGQVY